MSDQSYIGAVSAWAGTYAPRGWMFCQGQILSIAQNQALFSILGTTYGGDGINTFALPNLGGRAPVGQGQSPGTSYYALGEVAGTETETLTLNNMPAHTHAATATASASLPATTATATTATPGAGEVLATASGDYNGDTVNVHVYATGPGTVNLPLASSATVNVGAAGGSQPFSVLQPFQVLNYIICVEGIFPPHP